MAMKGVLLDTSAYAEFKRGVPEAAQIIQYAPVVGINSIVIGELLSGFAIGSRGTALVWQTGSRPTRPAVAILAS